MAKDKRIELKAGICGGRFMVCIDPMWVTNGHWMVRKNLVKVTKATPDVGKNMPDHEALTSEARRRSGEYSRGVVTGLNLNGSHPILADSEIKAWVSDDYLDFMELGTVWVSAEDEPIIITAETVERSSSPDVDKVIALVMPVRQTAVGLDSPGIVNALVNWIQDSKKEVSE